MFFLPIFEEALAKGKNVVVFGVI